MAPKSVYADRVPGRQQIVMGLIGKIDSSQLGLWLTQLNHSRSRLGREIVFFYQRHSDDGVVEHTPPCY